MSPLQQQLRWWSEQLGWAGIAAIALLLYVVVAYASAIMPAQQQLSQLEQMFAEEQRSTDRQQAQAKVVEESESSREARFYGDFPQRRDVSKILNRLYAAARHSNLTLQRGEYKLLHDSNTQFLRYEIELPMQGHYTGIQRFAYRALKESPTLALDEISFKREAANAALVQAKLHFTLYLLEQ